MNENKTNNLEVKHFETAKKNFQKKYGILTSILPELIAVRFGLKKALTLKLSAKNFTAEQQNALKKKLWTSKIFVKFYPSVIEGSGYINSLISNRKIDIINDDREENSDNRYSYPSCCTKAFLKKDGAFYFENRNRDLLAEEKMNVFDYRMNPFLITSPFHTYCHLPCSLRCSETLKYAKKLLNHIKRENKKLYSSIVYFNRAPVFYTDICGAGILFNGIARDRRIIYKNFYYDFFPQKNLIDRSNNNLPSDCLLYHKLIKYLSDGNTVELLDSELLIKRGSKSVARLARPDHLHWRIVDFR